MRTKMLFLIKSIARTVIRAMLRVYWLFPVNNNKVFFSSFAGTHYNCNPKYVFERLYQRNSDRLVYVWDLNDPKQYTGPQDNRIIFVKHRSAKYFYHIMTTGIYVGNWHFDTVTPIRKKTLFINLWHGGGAYKKVGIENIPMVEMRSYVEKGTELVAEETDCFISSSKVFSKVMSRTERLEPSKMMEIGMPRNDDIIQGDWSRKENVLKSYSIHRGEKILLYAPTYRGHSTKEDPNAALATTADLGLWANALERRFGSRWVVFVRAHHLLKFDMIKYQSGNGDVRIIDVSDYPDMQELLMAADSMVTDYSSCMWDFSFTEKPGFLFTPDLADFDDDGNRFYTPIDTWPYEYALSNEGIAALILNYNATRQKERIRKNHELFGNCETGRATETICEQIEARSEDTTAKSEN